MRLPAAVYELSIITDEDPRFDVFGFDDKKVLPEFAEAFKLLYVEDGLSVNWRPRKAPCDWRPLPVITRSVKPFVDYPGLCLIIPVFSRRAVNALGEMLTENGRLLALETEVGEYYAYVGHTKIDALNLQKSRLRRSSPNDVALGVGYFAFTAEKLADASIFRIPEQSNRYFVTDLFKEKVEQAKLNGFHFVPVWPLPEDSDWMMEETLRRKNRKKVAIVGEALILRFRLEAELPNEREQKLASNIESTLREKLRVDSLEDRYKGSVETTEFEGGEFRVFCTCPECEGLEAYLKPWLSQIDWPDGVICVKRYGNLYIGRAKERPVEYRKPNRPVEEAKWLKAKVESRLQRQSKGTRTKRKSHTESELPNEWPQQIRESAQEALSILGLLASADPQTIVSAIDQFVYDWQCGKHPQIHCDAEDLPYALGSLWGEQLVRQFQWQWKVITFHEHGDTKATGVVSPDRSLAIFPIHFIIGCLKDASVDATILLSFNMLKEHNPSDSKGPEYANFMEQVFRIVPRIASLEGKNT